MILQDIVISPDIVEEIKNHFDIPGYYLDIKSYNNNLQLKEIVFDDIDGNGKSMIIENYYKIAKSSNDFVKKFVNEFIDKLRYQNESKTIFLPEDKLELLYREDDFINRLLNLTKKTDSKILNSEKVLKAKILFGEFKDKLENVEVINYEEFISPPAKSSLFVLNRTIDLEYKEKFEINKILKHYLINTENIKINDKYLRNPKGGFKVLLNLLKECINIKNVKIYSDFTLKDPKKRPLLTKEEMRTKLCESFKCNFEINQIEINEHDRHIYTDNFDIFMSKGLDTIDNNKCINIKKAKITIDKI